MIRRAYWLADFEDVENAEIIKGERSGGLIPIRVFFVVDNVVSAQRL